MALFSQIPANVLHRANVGRPVDRRKKIRFYEEINTTDDETDIDTEGCINEPPTSSDSSSGIKKQALLAEKDFSDAIIQVDIKARTVDQQTQTEESLITRPLSDNDQQRLNSNTYYATYSIPRARTKTGREPPLKIGLTLRGKKRKVYYPDKGSDSD